MEEKSMRCRICGRHATGVHYGVLSCGGCKVFFKRGVQKNANYICYAGGSCSTQANQQVRRCKACRFWKCIELGMKLQDNESVEETQDRKSDRKKADSTHSSNTRRLPQIDLCTSTAKRKDIGRKCRVGLHSDNVTDLTTSSPISDPDDFNTSGDMAVANWQHVTVPENNWPSTSSDNHGFFDLSRSCQEQFIGRGRDTCNFRDPYVSASANAYDLFACLAESQRLRCGTLNNTDFLPFESPGNLDRNMEQMQSTLQGVAEAVGLVFGDQILQWTAYMRRALNNGQVVSQSETSLDAMTVAVNHHNSNHTVRLRTFVDMLPGIKDLDESAKRSLISGWKAVVCWMLHHGSFIRDSESYFTVGHQQFHYCRFWQENLTELTFRVAVYKFTHAFREIRLTKVEQYILMAIIMCEPDENDQSLNLLVLHRHYTDLLLDTIKHRSTNENELASACRKLEHFFGLVKLVHQLYLFYYNKTPAIKAAPSTIQLQYGKKTGIILREMPSPVVSG